MLVNGMWVKIKTIHFSPEMVDVCLSVRFSNKFGSNWLFDAIKRGIDIMIDSCVGQSVCLQSEALLATGRTGVWAGTRYCGGRDCADSGSKWHHQPKMAQPNPGYFGFIFWLKLTTSVIFDVFFTIKVDISTYAKYGNSMTRCYFVKANKASFLCSLWL